MKVKELLDLERRERQPTKQENLALLKVAEHVAGRLNSALRRQRVKAEAVVGGSGAKGTWLRGVHDIDLFVCFDYEKYREKSAELSEFLAAAVKKAFPKHERLHGSRDYFKVAASGYRFELVPILKIARAKQALNITDASMLHSAWVRKKIARNNDLADEIRLAKAFCRAQKVYGAESYVRGFSGYACEILTVHYGSFLKLLTAATRWRQKTAKAGKIVIDAEKHYKGQDPLAVLNEAKVQSELVVIDPVQKDRNATAALSSETLLRFLEAAESFLKNPDGKFFERKEETAESLKKKADVVVEAQPTEGKEDVAGAKLVKAHEHIKGKLNDAGFATRKDGLEWDGRKDKAALLWYAVRKGDAEPEMRAGPPASNAVHAENFRKEHEGKPGRKLLEKDGRLYARIERKYKRAEGLVRALIKEDAYLKEKVKAYRIV